MTRRTIKIPKHVKCKECGAGYKDLRGQGTEFRSNPAGDNPKRIKVQRYLCKKCGLIFTGSENRRS